jgi:membrane-associated phospholipid phosphatase
MPTMNESLMTNLTYKTHKTQKAIRNSKILFITSFIFLLFAFEYIFRSNATEFSNKIMKKLIKKGDTSHCHILEKFQFFESDGRFLLLFMLLNFTNTFAALSFVILDSFSVFLNGCLKMIYLEPRPYWIDKEMFPCLCAANYGNPSTTGMNQFLLFAVVYKSITTLYKEFNKVYVAVICAVPVALIYSSRYFQGAHSLNQLAFGGGIGFALYYIYFDIFEVDIQDPKPFNWMYNNFFKISFSLISVFLLVTGVHLLIEFEDNKEWLGIITKYCDVVQYNIFENESFRKTSKIFLIVGCFIGMWLESLYIKEYESFVDYNIHPERRFTNTSVDISLIRVVIMYGLFLTFTRLVFSHWIDTKSDTFFHLTVFGYIIPYLINGVFIFFLFKLGCKHLGLTFESPYLGKEKKERELGSDQESSTETADSIEKMKRELACIPGQKRNYSNFNDEKDVELRLQSNYKEGLL